jgi:hypothetical protein
VTRGREATTLRALTNELKRWRQGGGENGTWMVGELAWPFLRAEWARQFQVTGKYVEAMRTLELDAPPAGAEMMGLPVMSTLVPDSEDVVIAVVPPELDPRVKRILTGRA